MIKQKADNDLIIIRYADVLLIYAEAMIEQGQIDQSVRDAMNTVRARAYGVGKEETESYPEITLTDQSELRRIVRNERRIEFAWEGLRYMDIIRWKIAEKTLNRSIYGMLDPEELKAKVVSRGLWFWPMVPEIDEDGIANFDPMYDAGYIKQIAVTAFDESKQYLFPIPTKEILINDNLIQNPVPARPLPGRSLLSFRPRPPIPCTYRCCTPRLYTQKEGRHQHPAPRPKYCHNRRSW